jgi:hypothetical protein
MANVFIWLGLVGGVAGLWLQRFYQHDKEELSRFLENMDRRERIRPKLYQYAQFTKDTPLETRRSLIKKILDEYEYVDPSPLTKGSLGALTMLRNETYVDALDPKDWMGLVFIEFNLEFYMLKPYCLHFPK